MEDVLAPRNQDDLLGAGRAPGLTGDVAGGRLAHLPDPARRRVVGRTAMHGLDGGLDDVLRGGGTITSFAPVIPGDEAFRPLADSKCPLVKH